MYFPLYGYMITGLPGNDISGINLGPSPLSFPGRSSMVVRMCVLWWHGGVDVKRIGRLAGLTAALVAIAGTAVFALEEQKGVVAPQVPAADGAGAAVQSAAPSARSETGTEIRIPGLGKLGTLPKMDFGLELLYGATETDKPQEPSKIEGGDPADLTIRGEVKHRW